jgi:hypothetical protein
MRQNHGNYTVALNHGAVITTSGNSPQDKFKLPLSQNYNLPYQQHTLAVTDEPTSTNTPYFDIDFVQIERVVGQDK